MLEVIDLKERKEFIEQYIQLRNSYCELLLTSPVTLYETQRWLQKAEIEIRGLSDHDILVGVVILYLNRKGEVAFFVKEPSRGIGSQLLQLISKIAREKGLKSIWAWVLHDNIKAQRAFEKNAFVKIRENSRNYRGMTRQGLEYRLKLEE
jgi:RimJ/RimL family protein N-acetyltransferase